MPTSNIKAAEIIQEPFIPLVSLVNALKYWWVIVILVVISGLGGWLAYGGNPPQYEATAQFPVSIDLIGTGPLSQYEEDLAINSIGEILYHQEMFQRVVNAAAAQGIHLTAQEFRNQATLERKFSVFSLRVRSATPETSQKLVQIWLDQGKAVLDESYQHAQVANRLERYLQSLESCLDQLALSEPSYGICNRANFADIQKDLQAASTTLYQEKLASRGLFAGLTFGPAEPPVVSQRPVTYGQNQYVFAGSLIGLLLGIALIELGIPARWIKRL